MKKDISKSILTGFAFLSLLIILGGCPTEQTLYSVTFITDCEDTVAEQLVQENENSQRPNTVLVKEGYTFVNWYTDNTFVQTFDFNSPILANTIIYALWTVNDQILTLNSNNDSGETSQITLESNETTILPENTFTKVGYSFAGWATTIDGNKSYDDKDSYTIGTTNTTLYVIWIANNQILTLNSNNDSGETSQITLESNETTTLPKNTFTRIGYSFAGWSTTIDGNKSYDDEDSYTIGTTNTTLYAIWTTNDQILTLNANNDSGETSQITLESNETTTLPKNTFTRIGYSFAGWSTTIDGNKSYDDEESYTIGTTNTTLYALWTANDQILTLNSNNVSGETSQITLESNETTTLPENTFTKAGYSFAGWAITIDGDKSYDDEDSYTIGTTNTTLYALWTIRPITKIELISMISNNKDVTSVDTSQISDMSNLFLNNTTFNQDISGWDVSKVTNMNSMFSGASAFNQDIYNWNVTKVTDMGYMFNNAKSFDYDISKWDSSSVTNHSDFSGGTCPLYKNYHPEINFADNSDELSPKISLNREELIARINSGRDVTRINTSSIKDFSYMFYNNKDFNQDIRFWYLMCATDTSHMFEGATSFNQPIGNWTMYNVKTMDSMFKGATSFNQPIPWDIVYVENMHSMFEGATSFNKNISNWRVRYATDKSCMFKGATSFNQDLSKWDMLSTTDMSGMFQNATDFNSDISDWRVDDVTDMNNMFNGATNFDQDLSYWNVSKVTNMENMFTDTPLLNLDISCWDTSSVTSADNFSSGTAGLYKNFHPKQEWADSSDTLSPLLPVNRNQLLELIRRHKDVTRADVSSIDDFHELFTTYTTFNQDISGWNVSNAKNMNNMFSCMKYFNQDIGGWDVGNVTNMGQMFHGARAFNQDIGGWNTSNVENMNQMFYDAESFNQDISGWNVRKVTTPQVFHQHNCPILPEYEPHWVN